MNRRRALVGMLGGGILLLGLLSASTLASTERTDASYSDTEFATSPALGTVHVAPPVISQITTCKRPALNNSSQLDVQWNWASTAAPFSATTLSPRWTVNGSSVTPSTSGSGPYSTSFTGTLLGNVLGGLLGSSYTVSVTTGWTTPGNQTWVSAQSSVVTVTVPAIVGAPTCTFVNGS